MEQDIWERFAVLGTPHVPTEVYISKEALARGSTTLMIVHDMLFSLGVSHMQWLVRHYKPCLCTISVQLSIPGAWREERAPLH